MGQSRPGRSFRVVVNEETAGHPRGDRLCGVGVVSVCGVVCLADGLADAAAGGDFVAVRVRPLADLRELFRVPTLRRAAGSRAAGAAVDLAGCGDIVGERFAERVGVVVGEIDFVVAAVEREGHSAAVAVFDGVAGEVVDEVRGDFLRHGGGRLSLGDRLHPGITAPGERFVRSYCRARSGRLRGDV